MTETTKSSNYRFQLIFIFVFLFFMTIMIYAAYIAFSRQSGSTNLDVANIQKLRYDAGINHQSEREKNN